jgi:hypothetical protein
MEVSTRGVVATPGTPFTVDRVLAGPSHRQCLSSLALLFFYLSLGYSLLSVHGLEALQKA